MSSERTRIMEQIEKAGLVGIVRADSEHGLVETCRALAAGGATVVEITLTTPGAIAAIEAAHRELSGTCTIGVGSVIKPEQVEQAVDAGAQFVVCPTFKREVVERSRALGRPVIAGALTPTEMLTAWEAGADAVKVFPANHFGPKYFKDVLAPLPFLKLTPTGGVDLETVDAWFAAGAVCVGVGSALVKKELIAAGDWAGLTKLAQQWVEAVERARAAAV